LNRQWIFCSLSFLPLMGPRCDFQCRPDLVAQLVSRARSVVVILVIVFRSDFGPGLVHSVCHCEPMSHSAPLWIFPPCSRSFSFTIPYSVSARGAVRASDFQLHATRSSAPEPQIRFCLLFLFPTAGVRFRFSFGLPGSLFRPLWPAFFFCACSSSRGAPDIHCLRSVFVLLRLRF
jgi:hypothetical protein